MKTKCHICNAIYPAPHGEFCSACWADDPKRHWPGDVNSSLIEDFWHSDMGILDTDEAREAIFVFSRFLANSEKLKEKIAVVINDGRGEPSDKGFFGIKSLDQKRWENAGVKASYIATMLNAREDER